MNGRTLWERFQERYFFDRERGFALDISRFDIPTKLCDELEPRIQKAIKAMEELEKGAIANPDEKRMVGHYWLRDAGRAPTAELKDAISETLKDIKQFAADVHGGKIANAAGQPFKHVLVVGIGGSALGPQLVNQALRSVKDPCDIYFFDNTDPDGMENVLSFIPDLSRTIVLVISKSGGTKETRNGQLVAKGALTAAGLAFEKHFVAITGEGSELDKIAISEKWLKRFPMWDWVGGRTSEFSAVGLVAAALQGFDIEGMLRGAREMDELTRSKELSENPAALMALAWYYAGGGRGAKDMVVLPYKDRIELFSRYLQQLVMESLGKEHDLNGAVVNQGIAVYGNKGSTDQHAYVQQLRDGLNNFFVVFVEVLRDSSKKSSQYKLPKGFSAVAHEVEPGVVSGDYLSGFYLGTRRALYEKNRESASITIDTVDEFSLGMLIALFERTVGIYAQLVNINAYHQPGVEAGKKAAQEVLDIQKKVVAYLTGTSGSHTVEQIASGIGAPDQQETVFKIMRRMAANSRVDLIVGDTVFADKYSLA